MEGKPYYSMVPLPLIHMITISGNRMENRYTLNGRIAFIPQRGDLILTADETKTVSLNMPASRCLLLLIQQEGKTVARETFFEEVWIKHGSRVTSNGFYQNISLLRRAFKELGVDEDMIITVPRVGVRLDAALTVKEAQPTEEVKTRTMQAQRAPAAVDEPVSAEVAAASLPEKKRLRPRCSLLWGLAALLSCLMGGLIAWQSEFESYLQTYSPVNARFSQQCHFFANNDVVDHIRHVNFINRSKFACEEYSWIYLTLYPGQARVSVISCRQKFSQWRDNQCLTKYYIKEVAYAPT